MVYKVLKIYLWSDFPSGRLWEVIDLQFFFILSEDLLLFFDHNLFIHTFRDVIQFGIQLLSELLGYRTTLLDSK